MNKVKVSTMANSSVILVLVVIAFLGPTAIDEAEARPLLPVRSSDQVSSLILQYMRPARPPPPPPFSPYGPTPCRKTADGCIIQLPVEETGDQTDGNNYQRPARSPPPAPKPAPSKHQTPRPYTIGDNDDNNYQRPARSPPPPPKSAPPHNQTPRSYSNSGEYISAAASPPPPPPSTPFGPTPWRGRMNTGTIDDLLRDN